MDKRLFEEDIDGSEAYAKALEKINLITTKEADVICEGLEIVKEEWKQNIFDIKEGDEDIHTANERRLKVFNIFIQFFCH